MIVEFTGLPGAGKSTAAEALVAAARRRGVPARTGADVLRGTRRLHGATGEVVRSAATAGSLLRRPLLAVTLIRCLSSSGRSRAEKWYAFRHFWTTVMTLEAARRDDASATLTVLHEGICQRAFLALVDGDGAAPRRVAERLLSRAPRPDVIVRVCVPAAVGLSRVATRGHGGISYRFDALSDAELRARMSEGERLIADAVELLCTTHPSVEAIHLDGEDLQGVTDELERLVGRMTPEVFRST